MSPNDRQPIIVADAGPLIRLAAAGLLDTVHGLNRRIVLVDRVEDEVTGDRSKPYADKIARWIDQMGAAILRVRTIVGAGIEALRGKQRSPEEDALLKVACAIQANIRCSNSSIRGGRPKLNQPSLSMKIGAPLRSSSMPTIRSP